MATSKVPLEVVLKAVDKATPVIRAATVSIHRLTEPLEKVNNLKIFDQLKAFDKALNLSGAAKALGGVGTAVGQVGAELFSMVGKLAGIGLAAAAGFGAIIKGAMDAGDQLGEQASRVGMTVDAFASMRFAAEQADVSQEAFAESMDKLNKQLGDMTVGKGGEFLAFLNEIGPGFAKQMKGAKTTEAAMALLTDAFARIDDPARRATLAAHAFGKGNMQMGEFLHQGSAAVQEQQRRFMELLGTQEEFARKAGELDNATRETSMAFEGLRNAMAAKLFPVLTELAGKVTRFLVDNRDGLTAWAEKTAKAIKEWVDSGGFERLVESLSKTADTIGKVVEWLGPMGTAMAGITAMSLPLIASLGNLGVSLITLAIESAPLVVTAFSALAPIIASAAAATWGAVTATAALALEFAPFLLAAAGVILGGKALIDNWDELKWQAKDLANTIKLALVDAWNAVKPIWEKLGKLPLIGGAFRFGASITDSLLPQQATMGAAAAAPASSSMQSTEARVSVDFANLPPGAQVSTAPNSSQPVDLSVNYSMVTP